MIDSYCIQRLRPPPKGDMEAKAEQVFGGANLLLRPEAWKLLQGVFSFDYMGAAEYEFGTIPRCLKAMAADHEQLQAFEMVLPAKSIEPNWNRERKARTKAGKVAKKQPAHPGIADRTVYVLARKEHVEGVREYLPKLASGKMRTQSSPRFPQALDPIGEFDNDVCGWLELDNGYFFFLDKAMWEKTAQLFTGKMP
jgi:hypothetical protein